jgi:hypothetical protein
MGCDIHMFIETRVGDGEWQLDPHHEWDRTETHYAHLSEVSATGRNYHLFGALANVRSSGPEAKGLPEDVCHQLREYLNDGDNHSHSYHSLQEFKQVLLDMKFDLEKNKSTNAYYKYSDYWNNDGEVRPPDYTTIVHYCEKLIMDHEAEKILVDNLPSLEVRLVYCFDN